MNCHKLIFLLLTAILFILAACGSGDLVDLSQGSEEYLKMTDVKDNLAANGGLIQRCKGDVDLEEKPECKVFVTYVPPQGNSSSSEEWVPPEKSSSSAATEPTPSSSTGTTPSSSSVPSSSSAPPPPPPSSSSAATCGNNCAPIPAFTCAATPANPVSGDETTVNINITGSGEGCSTRAYVEIEAKTPFQQLACLAQSEIDVGVPIVTAGSKSASCLNNKGETFSGSWTWPTSGAITVIKGAVTCGTGVSQNTEAKTCAITIQAPPTPTKTGSIKFSNVDYSSGSSSYFYIGSEPQITHDVAITNGGDAEARCGDVETRIKGNADAAGTVT
ncbi:MAG: hypothetical protein FWC26_06185, partial [Fibromonadales bacterium]|nr:hypothetical protein [Fibromonadales bacterium]